MNGLHWITRRLCGCDEIECHRCTKSWVPIEKRPKKEIVESYRELQAANEELRRRLQVVAAAAVGNARFVQEETA